MAVDSFPSANYAHEFPLDENLVYLNHAAVGPWPRRSADAVQRFAEENAVHGARHYPRWTKVETALREQCRLLLNAPSAADIALLKNTSEGLSVIAYGLPWQAGDNVVISDQEFPSNRIVWESLNTLGVECREAVLGADPEQALFARVDRRTRLLAISSVQYASGLRMDLARIGKFCRERGILFCVDAIQTLGALPLDVVAIHADFVVADGHKWLLGPEGLATFYCRAERRDQLQLRQYGWHMVEQLGDYDRRDWRPARSARRFECGSPNMLGIHALHASLSLLLEVGMQRVAQGVLDNAAYLIEQLRTLPHVELLSPTDRARHAGIVTFRHRQIDGTALWRALAERGVICAARGGGVRFSPHFHTTRTQLDRAIESLRACIRD